jgi:hypothetical protein
MLIPYQRLFESIERFEKTLYQGKTIGFENAIETTQPYTRYGGTSKLNTARVASALLQYRLLDIMFFLEPSPRLPEHPNVTTSPVPFSRNKVSFIHQLIKPPTKTILTAVDRIEDGLAFRRP